MLSVELLWVGWSREESRELYVANYIIDSFVQSILKVTNNYLQSYKQALSSSVIYKSLSQKNVGCIMHCIVQHCTVHCLCFCF